MLNKSSGQSEREKVKTYIYMFFHKCRAVCLVPDALFWKSNIVVSVSEGFRFTQQIKTALFTEGVLKEHNLQYHKRADINFKYPSTLFSWTISC